MHDKRKKQVGHQRSDILLFQNLRLDTSSFDGNGSVCFNIALE